MRAGWWFFKLPLKPGPVLINSIALGFATIVLFRGFVVFAFSEVGGAKALGVWMSGSLLIALFTNLIILPTLLMGFGNGKHKRYPYNRIGQMDEAYLNKVMKSWMWLNKK